MSPPDGKVFAVSWRGPGDPGPAADARQLLRAVRAGARRSAPQYDHHHLAVRTPDVVVQSSGRTRAFFGRAWAPALLPQNFSLNDIH